MARSVPFIERPTWQRVKDLQEAAMLVRATMQNVLSMIEYADRPNVREAFRRDLNAALTQLRDATGIE